MLEHAKTINNVRNNSEKPRADRINSCAKAHKDSVIIVGDSMIKHVNGRHISHSHSLKVRPNPGASAHDLMDYIVKPALRKKPKALVIHTGITIFNTMKMVKKLVKVIKEIDHEKETDIIFSGLIQRETMTFTIKQKKSTVN